MPQVGLEGQDRIAAATIVVAGDDLACEVVARSLSAAGVGALRLLRRGGALPPVVAAALVESNPDLRIDTRGWPTGAAWVEAIRGAAVVVRSGFDDDPMLRAAILLGVPVIAARGREGRVDVLSFRKQGPCPHQALDVAPQVGDAPQDSAAAVIAAHIAAAEALVLVTGAAAGQARARHVVIPLEPGRGSDSAGSANDGARAADIPWTPECFACGGSASEMSFA